MDAVKVVTRDGRGDGRRGAVYRRRLPGSLKIAEIGVTAGFLMIAKDFIPQMGSRSFAIMNGGWECGVSGLPGATVTSSRGQRD
jgi:hypothetical protein